MRPRSTQTGPTQMQRSTRHAPAAASYERPSSTPTIQSALLDRVNGATPESRYPRNSQSGRPPRTRLRYSRVTMLFAVKTNAHKIDLGEENQIADSTSISLEKSLV